MDDCMNRELMDELTNELVYTYCISTKYKITLIEPDQFGYTSHPSSANTAPIPLRYKVHKY